MGDKTVVTLTKYFLALFIVLAILAEYATARPQNGVPAAASAANAMDRQAALAAASPTASRSSGQYSRQWGYRQPWGYQRYWGYYRPGSYWGYRPGR